MAVEITRRFVRCWTSVKCAARWKTRCGFFSEARPPNPVRTMVTCRTMAAFSAYAELAGALG